MATLSRNEAKALLEKVLSFSQAEACEANLNGSATGNLRYARNTVSTSGLVEDLQLVVQSNFGKKSGTATINELDDGSLEKIVRRAEELARLAPDNPEFVPPLGPQQYAEVRGFFDSTAKIDAAYRAQAAGASISAARQAEAVAAGYLEHSAGFEAMANSKGLFAYHPSTDVSFSVTMRSEDGTGSGYDMELINAVKNAVTIPVIASSGAGCAEHFYEVFARTDVESALAAGIFHRKEVAISDIKEHLKEKVEVRL